VKCNFPHISRTHGAFRLWHTFSGENLYTAPQGTTNNLMDYNGTNSELNAGINTITITAGNERITKKIVIIN